MKNYSYSKAPIVLWNLTNRCNLYCEYCYQNAGEHSEKELPLSKCLNLVDEFHEAGVWAISFSGGEVLLRKEKLCEIAKYAEGKGIFNSILTNGTFLSKKIVDELKKNGIKRASINLDSPSRIMHDSYREKTGCWEKALEGILNSMEGGLEVEISATLTQRNFSELEKFIQFGMCLGVNEIEFTTLIPVGRGKNISDECLNTEQMEEVLKIAAKYYLDGFKIMASDNPEFVTYMRKNLSKQERKTNHLYSENEIGCMAGVGWCAIQPNGLVTPCVLMPDLVAGDVKKESFNDVWQNSNIFKQLRNRDNLKGKCGACEDKYVCGGCRARAYALTTDCLEEDSFCVVYKKQHKDKI